MTLSSRAAIALCVFLTCCEYALPQSGAPSLAAPAENQVVTPDLSGAEKLYLRFRGYPELTGDYRISADQTISIPAVGRIAVTGSTAADLERTLSAKVRDMTGKESYVSVEVIQYKPVFVTGVVKTSGSVEWRPGMTVLQAVVLAGGIQFGGIVNASGQLSDNAARKAEEDERRLIAALARARAELKGDAAIQTPTRLVELVGRANADQLMESERAGAIGRRVLLQDQLMAVERGKTIAASEVQTLRQQELKIREQLMTRSNQVQRLRDLLSKGVIQSDRVYNEELRVSDLEEKISGIQVNIARVEGLIAGADREAATLKKSRELEIISEAARLERELANVQIDLRGTADVTAVTTEQPRKLAYEIVRSNSGRRAGTDTTLLSPGDTVIVTEAKDAQR